MDNLLKEFEEVMPYPTLRDYQLEYCQMQHEAQEQNKNFLNILPTGMGKTVAAYWASYKAWKEGTKCIILVPVRQLATELLREFPKHLPMVNVLRDTGADREQRQETGLDYESADVIVMTTERLMAVFNSPNQRSDILTNVNYCVFDEIHKIQDNGRGSALEWVIMNLKRDYPSVNIIGLSATLPNYEEFADWLDAKYYYRPPEDRPIPLEYHYNNPISWKFRKADDKRMAKFKQLLQLKTFNQGQFLVFMYSKKAIEKYARMMARLPESAPREALWEKGIGIHHRDVKPEEQKDEVVQMFNDGKLDVIFCTPTLAEGVNTAAVNVVLFDISVWDGLNCMHKKIEEPNLRQMWGRAGRAGYGVDKGHVFFLGDDAEMQHAEVCVKNPQSARSQFGRVMIDKILTAIVNEMANTEEEIYSIIKESFLFFQHGDLDETTITQSLETLEKYKFINNYSNKYFATEMGRRVVKNAIKVHTIIDAQTQLWNTKNLNSLYDIFKIFLANEEFLTGVFYDAKKDSNYVQYAERFFEKSDYVYEPIFVNFYNDMIDRHVKIDMREPFLKVLAFIFQDDIIRGKKPFTLDTDLSMKRQDGSGLIDRISFILGDTLKQEIKDSRFFGTVSAGLRYGTLDDKKLELSMLGGVGEKTLKLLFDKGINTKEKFFATSLQDLKFLGMRISEARFTKLKEEAGFIIDTKQTADLNEWF